MINQFFCLFIVIELDNYLSSKIILDYSNDKFDSDNLNLYYSNKQDCRILSAFLLPVIP